MKFMTFTEAFQFARLKATKGRKTWLVWNDTANNAVFAAWLSEASLVEAIAAVGPTGRLFSFGPGSVAWTNISPALAQVMLANARAGHLGV